jgi:CheY-like chemotaxis protein
MDGVTSTSSVSAGPYVRIHLISREKRFFPLPIPGFGRNCRRFLDYLIGTNLFSFQTAKEGESGLLASRKPTLLVVDDERPVRELICLNLRASGFDVFEAKSGREALEIAATPETHIDILISDIIMPQMNGRDLANRIASMKPFIKVLFMSAYTAEILSNFKLCPDGADFIKKPFTMAALLERIGRVWASSPKWKELVSQDC